MAMRKFDSFSIEKTLALITQEMIKHAPEIRAMIEANDFEVLAERTATLSSEEVAEFYSEHYNEDYFPNLVRELAGKEVLTMCLAKNNAVSDWLSLIGLRKTGSNEVMGSHPGSIEACFKETFAETTKPYELIHGSKNLDSAMREIHLFFPTMIINTLLHKRIGEYLSNNTNPILLRGLQEVCEKQPEDPIVWLADWLLMHNVKEL